MSRRSDGEHASAGRSLRRDLPVVAVLPYRVVGDPILGAYFAEGITTEIIDRLRCFAQLFVINAASSLNFRDATAPIASVGRNLGARYVVAGWISRRGQTLRFSQHLYEVEDGALVWTDEVEADLGDLFDLQSRIVAQIVNGIVAPLTEAEIERTIALRSADLDAYHLVLRALPGLRSLDRAEFDRAAALLDAAMAADPTFAAPMALKARLNSVRIGQGWTSDRSGTEAEALRLAQRAIELDPSNSLALATAGHLSAFLGRDFDRAIELFERALICCPNDALAWSLSSITQVYCGHAEEARTRASLAIRLSPRDRAIFLSYFCAGLAAYADKDYAEAVRWLRASIAENARYTSSYKVLAAALIGLGCVSEARRLIGHVERMEPGFLRTGSQSAPIRDEELKSRYARQLQTAGALA